MLAFASVAIFINIATTDCSILTLGAVIKANTAK